MIDDIAILHFITSYGTTNSRKQIEVMNLSTFNREIITTIIDQLFSRELIIEEGDKYSITDNGRLFLRSHPSDIDILKCILSLTNDKSKIVSRDQILSCFDTDASSNVEKRLLEMGANNNEILIYQPGTTGGYSISSNATYFKSSEIANWYTQNIKL